MSETHYRFEHADCGLESIRLSSSLVELVIVPGAGGKIVALIDRRSGRNWLWCNPHIPVSRPRPDADFGRELDSGGWDEVLFSVRPGRIHSGAGQILAIPDHGDLIHGQWTIDDLRVTGSGDLSCAMTATGQAATYHFGRRMILPANSATVRFEYVLDNQGVEPLPFYWCAHPLLAVEPGAHIDIDAGTPFRVDDAATQRRSGAHAAQRWPTLQLDGDVSHDVSRSFASNGASRPLASKLFLRTPATGRASLVQGSAGLTFCFDPKLLPWLGLWINNGAWSGCGSVPYTNLAIEPATVGYDSVNEAISNDAVAWLAPGERREWWLRLELQA